MKLHPVLIGLFVSVFLIACGSEGSRGGGGDAGSYYDGTEEEETLPEEDEKGKSRKPEVVDNISAVHEGPDDEEPYQETEPRKDWRLPYDLDRPTAKFKLPSKLDEISGLTMTSGGQRILTINDEKGDVFFIDKETGELVEDFKFGKKGDYEGIEMVGDDVFVVKSNGDIFAIENLGTENQRTETFKTFLNSDFDVEGLAYDEKLHRLLLACKRYPGKGYEGQKAIYGWSIMSEKLAKEPAYLIHSNDISDYFKMEGVDQRLLEIFTPNAGAEDFAPSGISLHPVTGNLYILSGPSRLLLILNQEGDVLHMERLDKGLFPQAEGICFERDGTLYISTEGKGRRGRIFRFPMKGW